MVYLELSPISYCYSTSALLTGCHGPISGLCTLFCGTFQDPELNLTANTYYTSQHPNTPLFNDNQVTVSPELFKAISARLQAQLRDASNTSLLEGGSSITIPYNSPEQPPIPKVSHAVVFLQTWSFCLQCLGDTQWSWSARRGQRHVHTGAHASV